MTLTLSVFALDLGGSERILRRSTITEDAAHAYAASPASALSAMLPVGGTRPDGFRITDARGRVRVAHTGARRVRFVG